MSNVIVKIFVVGFHHKRGCEIEFVYPSCNELDLSPNISDTWKNLCSLAIPDGAHKINSDVFYFIFPSDGKANNQILFGISCFKQISSYSFIYFEKYKQMLSRDVEFEIVGLVLSNGALPKESRNDSVFHECIRELYALPVCGLSAEPSCLRDCYRRIIEENYKLAYDNYSTFIQTAECTKLIFKDFEVVENKNEILLNKIPHFVSSCNNFVEKCRKSISMANMNSLTLKNHNQILEILEIPQLLEACIRNNYIDEALEVIAHTRKLERRHQNIGIIMNVAYESRLAAQKLLDQLFQQLGGNLQLPVCLKIVGFLRRMDCLPDSLLRMKFLQCRDNYLKNLLRSLPTNDPFFHATKYMEITRVNLFDIATQYRAVFNDDDIYVTSADADSCHQGMLFSSWLVMRIRNFMISLAEDLEIIVQNSVDYNHVTHVQHSSKTSSQSIGSKLQSLLGQSMYFGLSLSRIGSDFRGLLMSMFYQAILKYINLQLSEIPDCFSECISSYKWTVNMDDDEIFTINVAIQTNEELIRTQKSEEIIAPNKLMNHPLLAMLINQMLSILEDIRLCCPRVLKERICQSFYNTIDQLMNCLVKFYQEETSNFSRKEQQSFLTMISVFVCSFLPHINLCLTVLFAADTAHLSNQKYALDIVRLSNNFQTILPESFFVPVLEDDLVADVLEELSTINRTRVSSRIAGEDNFNGDEYEQLIINDKEILNNMTEIGIKYDQSNINNTGNEIFMKEDLLNVNEEITKENIKNELKDKAMTGFVTNESNSNEVEEHCISTTMLSEEANKKELISMPNMPKHNVGLSEILVSTNYIESSVTKDKNNSNIDSEDDQDRPNEENNPETNSDGNSNASNESNSNSNEDNNDDANLNVNINKILNNFTDESGELMKDSNYIEIQNERNYDITQITPIDKGNVL